MSKKLAIRMKELEERTTQVRLEDERRERDFQERMKAKANEEVKKLQVSRGNASGETCGSE